MILLSCLGYVLSPCGALPVEVQDLGRMQRMRNPAMRVEKLTSAQRRRLNHHCVARMGLAVLALVLQYERFSGVPSLAGTLLCPVAGGRSCTKTAS